MAARTDQDIWNLALVYAGVNEKVSDPNEVSAAAQACTTIYSEMRRKVYSAFRWPHSIKRQQLTPLFGNQYDAAHKYATGELVQFGNNVYRSLLDNNTNNEPDLNASAAWWAQVTRDGYAYAIPPPADMLDPIEIWEKPGTNPLASPLVFSFVQDTSGLTLRNPRSSGRTPFKVENANDGTDQIIILSDVDTPILRYTADVSNPSALPSHFVDALAHTMSGPLAMAVRGDEKKATACEVLAAKSVGQAFIIAMRDQQEDEEPVSEFEAARQGVP